MSFKEQGLNVHDIFNRPMPPDAIGQIKRLAADLAEGTLLGYWSQILRLHKSNLSSQSMLHRFSSIITINEGFLKEYYLEIWDKHLYSHEIIVPDKVLQSLIGIGYLVQAGDYTYIPSEKAYALLETRNVEIFISYSIKESSGVAMLVWSELSRMGYNPFIDIRNLSCGDEWHGVLENKVKSSHVFIVILDKNTLASPYVRQEIHWARSTNNLKIIPILLAGYSKEDLQQDQNGELGFLLEKNLIQAKESTSAEFISMTNQLLAGINLIK